MVDVAKRDNNRIPVMLGVGNDGSAEVLYLIVDPSTRRLLTDALTEEQGHGAIGTGRKTVSSAGTAEVLASSTSCKRVTIQALSDNAGPVTVGDANVVASESTQRGITIDQGFSVVLVVDNLNLVYIDVRNNDDGVTFLYEN